MAKTTIDGLRVREPSSQRQHNVTGTSSAHVVDMGMTARSNTARKRVSSGEMQQRRELIDSIDAIRGNQTGDSSFLDPVQTFDFDNEPTTEPDDEFSGAAENDWSELLSNFGQAANTTSKSADNIVDNLAEAWGGSETSDFLADAIDDEPEEEETPRKQPVRKPRKVRAPKKRHIGRTIAIVTVCLLVIGGGVFYKWGDELISKLTGGRSGLWDAISSVMSDEVPFETDNNGRTNVLIFGTEGYNMSGDTALGQHEGAQLTDSIMVASFDQKTKDVALLSLPRDLKVSRACSAGKINEVFWCHNQDGTDEERGAMALMEQVGDVLGIDFQYYAHINWASLIDIIDTLGGITVTLDENIADYGWTNAVAQAGVPMQVNGEQALGLARARHGTIGGDFTRGNTQQKIVEGIVNKFLENGIDVGSALGLLNILGDNLRSNFTTDNVKAGVRLISGFNIGNIRQVPLVDYNTNTFYVTTATINEVSYVVPSAGNNNYSEIHKYVEEMFNSDPMAREKARIAVYNASGQYGVAGAERDKLVGDGFNVVGVGDATLGDCEETYCVYKVSDLEMSATAEKLAERYGVTIRGREELPESIEPGETDFVIVLGLNGSEM